MAEIVTVLAASQRHFVVRACLHAWLDMADVPGVAGNARGIGNGAN